MTQTSLIDSQYLRQNEMTTTTEEGESYFENTFKKQNLQAEVLDYK